MKEKEHKGGEVVRVAQKATQHWRATQRQQSLIPGPASVRLCFFLSSLNDSEMMQFKLFICCTFLKKKKIITRLHTNNRRQRAKSDAGEQSCSCRCYSETYESINQLFELLGEKKSENVKRSTWWQQTTFAPESAETNAWKCIEKKKKKENHTSLVCKHGIKNTHSIRPSQIITQCCGVIIGQITLVFFFF